MMVAIDVAIAIFTARSGHQQHAAANAQQACQEARGQAEYTKFNDQNRVEHASEEVQRRATMHGCHSMAGGVCPPPGTRWGRVEEGVCECH
jgi:hypothetical protein